MISPVFYENDKLIILDQTKLPGSEIYIELDTKEDVWDAIKELKVRGAPAIGVAAAYGVYVSLKNYDPDRQGNGAGSGEVSAGTIAESRDGFVRSFREIKDHIASARPTAVNLFWALERMENKMLNTMGAGASRGERDWKEEEKYIMEELLSEAHSIRNEDIEACKAMGEYGLSLLKPGMGILTHCNAGTLATAMYGTCLAPVHLGQERGYDFKVFADETRPLLQGARLTSWELSKSGVDVTLICDNMASTVMKQGKIQAVVVGCDRMAANGDGANKIGTSGVAILAKEYRVPFYMFVPTSTIDMDTATGDDIVIEERDGDEIREMWYEKPMAPDDIKMYNPAFDVTDHKYITAVITEKGVVYPPYEKNLRKVIDIDED